MNKSRYQGKPCIHGHGTERYVSQGVCCVCSRLAGARYVASDKEAHRARYRKYRANNLERCRERGLAQSRSKLPAPTRPEPTVCECCGTPSKRTLSLDHCHITGKFRGWLCNSCNRAIGLLGDDAVGIRRALVYLEQLNEESMK